MNPSPIEISALMVTFNSESNIVPALKSLMAEMASVRGEVLVYDNNSSDATINAIRSVSPNIQIIQSNKNLGFAAGNNRAAEVARGKYLLFANPDLILDKGCLSELLEVFGARPDAGAVAARLRNEDNSFQPTCRNFPDMKNIFFSRGSALAAGKDKSGHGRYTLGDFDKITSVPAAAATCLMMEREFFLKIGGFDERFFLFMEDTDLCLRISRADRTVYFVPGAGAVHLWGRGTPASSFRRRFHHHLSAWKYFLKHYPNGFSLFLLPVALIINFTMLTMKDLLREK
nr:glycosyltransferase family 2 protein [candidate division Zixibacteria bacterium]